MSLKRGVTALYANQAYGVVVSIGVTPLLLRLLGPEGYGLVGVFIALQAWLQALDLGVPALLTRQVARWRGGAADADTVVSALRALEWSFAVVGALAVGALVASSSYVADGWLTPQEVTADAIQEALWLMTFACGLRWMTSPYRAVIVGAEGLAWLASVSAIFTTLRFVAVLPWVWFAADPINAFFKAQLALSALELLLFVRKARTLLGPARSLGWRAGARALGSGGHGLGWSMALATVLWFASTQADRVLLSRLIPLADFGYYTLAIAVAGAIIQLTTPLSQALMARLNLLKAAGDEAGLRRTYRQTAQLVSAVAACSAAVLAGHAEAVVYVWTGSRATTAAVAPVLAAYAIAQALLAVVALPYALQFARGDLRMHLVGGAAMLASLIPAIVWGAWQAGAVGAGWAWAAVLALYLVLWVPVVHHVHAPGLHGQWIREDVLLVMLPATLVALVSGLATPWWPTARVTQFAALVAVLMVALAGTYAAAPLLRAAVSSSVPPPVRRIR